MTKYIGQGFAVIQNGRLDIRTVGPTWRSAAVNWLFTERGKPMYAWTTDAQIESIWHMEKVHAKGDPEILQVQIETGEQ